MDPSDQELVAGWQAAEERLYPVVMVRPELYERYLSLVRAVADSLRDVGTVGALARRFRTGDSIMATTVERTGIATEGMDLGLAAGAAFCLRYREILAETGRRDALRRIEEARARGEPWVIVHETDRFGDALYRRLELHLPSGAGLHAFVELDAETGGRIYCLEALPLDPRTGSHLEELPPIAPRRTYVDEDDWRSAVDRLRTHLEGSDRRA